MAGARLGMRTGPSRPAFNPLSGVNFAQQKRGLPLQNIGLGVRAGASGMARLRACLACLAGARLGLRAGASRPDFLKSFFICTSFRRRKADCRKRHLNKIQEGDLRCGDIAGRYAS